MLVYWHAFTPQDYGITGFYDLARRGRHLHTSTIKMCYQYPREPKESLRQSDGDIREQVIPRPLKRAMRRGLQDKYYISRWNTGLSKVVSGQMTYYVFKRFNDHLLIASTGKDNPLSI
jgi:hypothetical protein